MGTWSFPGVKLPERGADYPTPSSAEVKNVELYLYPLWAFEFVTGYLHLYLFLVTVRHSISV
jgi:hypothetical protein